MKPEVTAWPSASITRCASIPSYEADIGDSPIHGTDVPDRGIGVGAVCNQAAADEDIVPPYDQTRRGLALLATRHYPAMTRINTEQQPWRIQNAYGTLLILSDGYCQDSIDNPPSERGAAAPGRFTWTPLAAQTEVGPHPERILHVS
jgi:hypothetical protein